MDPRQRYLETILFGHPDHVPLLPGGPRESTLSTWHMQGLPEGADWREALCQSLGLPAEALVGEASLPDCFKMNPIFEEKVLEHKDGHYIVQDWMGAITEISDVYDYTYIRSAKDFVTRKWHRFPVQNRQDWERIRWRYDARDAARFTPAFWEQRRQAEASGQAVSISLNGPFWQMREWLGMEGLCYMMADDPELVTEMAEFWRRFTMETLTILLQKVRLDELHLSEDMAYKAHSMISPAMARRYLQPCYLSWRDLLRAYDVAVLGMDSDGHVGDLIPLWIESGINCCDPLEVAAGNDIVSYRCQYGRRMAFRGGIDKRAIAAGGETMRAELARVAPVLREGGYIPGCDHGVPPDVSWPDFVAYTRELAQLLGWL
jgi:hypothetical protein